MGVHRIQLGPREAPHQTGPAETQEIRRGHVVSRPAGMRIPHSFRAGPSGLTYLAYGTGVIARLELLAYSDGEPA